MDGCGGYEVMRLMRIEDEYGSVLQCTWALLYPADTRVAVLDRRRKVACLKRRPHPCMFGDWHATREDECFGSAADAAIEGANEYVAIGDVR